MTICHGRLAKRLVAPWKAPRFAAPPGRELQTLFAVDLFNEGLDIPAIDTVLLLRPAESAVMFLQQLGRGLRLSPDTGKSCLTVLDFIGQQHRRFRFDLRYRALLGGSRRQLQEQLQQGFPFLPPGCRLVLDRVASLGGSQRRPTRRKTASPAPSAPACCMATIPIACAPSPPP